MLYHDTIGLIHLASSLLAVITGSMVLAMKKGTRNHRRIGYVYAVSMVILLVTAFSIYRLFGGFGIFHVAAVVSSITLIAGMIPALRRNHPLWPVFHFSWMYWSVIGLYAAFVSEMLTRIPSTPFFGMVGIATGIVMFAGGFYFYRSVERWKQQFKDWS